LERTRQPQIPDVVPKVPPDLTENRWNRVSGKRLAARRVETVHRFHQPEIRYLQEVIEWLGVKSVTAGQTAGQRHEPLDYLLARRR
jgi:hypothetical protein